MIKIEDIVVLPDEQCNLNHFNDITWIDMRNHMYVGMKITAPKYWWSTVFDFRDYDKISIKDASKTMLREFTMDDFSHEHLIKTDTGFFDEPYDVLHTTVEMLNYCYHRWLQADEEEGKSLWQWQVIQLLPNSFNSTRTMSMNYKTLSNLLAYAKKCKGIEWDGFKKEMKKIPRQELL